MARVKVRKCWISQEGSRPWPRGYEALVLSSRLVCCLEGPVPDLGLCIFVLDYNTDKNSLKLQFIGAGPY